MSGLRELLFEAGRLEADLQCARTALMIGAAAGGCRSRACGQRRRYRSGDQAAEQRASTERDRFGNTTGWSGCVHATLAGEEVSPDVLSDRRGDVVVCAYGRCSANCR